MCGVNHMLRASTLVETLVTMLVAGIVFLAATEGLELVSRQQIRRAEALRTATARREGCQRLATLLLTADSLTEEYGCLRIFRAGTTSTLALHDSMLLFTRGAFVDTLLNEVESLRLAVGETEADTLEIAVRGRRLGFPILKSARLSYETAIAEIEKEYGYEAR